MGHTLKKAITGIIAICVILLCTAVSRGESVKLATGEWIPFTSATMEDYGEFSRLVTTLLKEMNIEPDYTFYPWRRCFDAVIKGRVWAAFPYSYTEERAEKVWFSEPLSCSKTLFFYYVGEDTSKNYSFNELEDLKLYRIGGVIGYYYEEIFKKAGLQVDYVNKEIQGLKKLKLGRIDLMPYNEQVGWHLIKTHFPDEIDRFRTIDKPFSVSTLLLIVSKTYPGSQQLLDRFNLELQKAKENGLIKITQCQ